MTTMNNLEVPINPGEKHVLGVMGLDNSHTMLGHPIKELNNGLKEFENALMEDELARGRADIRILAFNNEVESVCDWCPACEFNAPSLEAHGLTAMNQAINDALDEIEVRTDWYKNNGVQFYKPWLFLLTDGSPTDTELGESTRARLRSEILKGLNFYPMAIGPNADSENLRSYYPEGWKDKMVLHASKENFKEAFVYISKSIAEVLKAAPENRETEQESLPEFLTAGS